MGDIERKANELESECGAKERNTQLCGREEETEESASLPPPEPISQLNSP